MSETLHFAEHTLQEVALIVMGLVYTSRLIWLHKRFKAGKERQPATGSPRTTPRKGMLYSWGIIAMPWAMESTRTKPLMYLQFVIFHLGVAAAIGLSFIIPYAPTLLENAILAMVLHVSIGAAFFVGVIRIFRRAGSRMIRAMSSPDDYFSLFLLTGWFAVAFLSVPNNIEAGETVLFIYFVLTAFFLIYVPFSKISHYLYYPFTRYWFGKSMGRRGTYPMHSSTNR